MTFPVYLMRTFGEAPEDDLIGRTIDTPIGRGLVSALDLSHCDIGWHVRLTVIECPPGIAARPLKDAWAPVNPRMSELMLGASCT